MKKYSIFKLIFQRKITISIAIFLGLGIAVASGALIFYRYFTPVRADANCSSSAKSLTISSGVGARIIDNTLAGTATLCDSISVEGYDITVTGTGTILTLASFNTFNSLTITNGAQVTHDAIVATDVTSGSSVLTSVGEVKKVHLQITGALTMDGGGKIDTSGKGYPGGTAIHTAGYGDGGGDQAQIASSTVAISYGASGGGFGGAGGDGKTDQSLAQKISNGGLAYSNYYDPFIFRAGSGSGYASQIPTNFPYQKVGVSGGGRIYIRAATINIINGTILANGTDGVTATTSCTTGVKNRAAFGAGGAGGTIWLVADTILSQKVAGATPSISGGTAFGDYSISDAACANNLATVSTIHDGVVGVAEVFVEGKDLTSSYQNFFGFLSSKGGAPSTTTVSAKTYTAAGGGGGGRIRVEAKAVKPSCTIASGATFIPAECEGGNVIISSGATVVMDSVLVDQSTGVACTDNITSLCDSTRHFNSFTVKSGGKITHTSVLPTDLMNNGVQYPYLRKDDTFTGSARWRKVDIIVDSDLLMESGSSIDVSGKGYSGATDIANGFGPAPGAKGTNQGGNYAGIGGSNTRISYPINFESEMISNDYLYSRSYFSNITLENHPLFDFGSGGGKDGASAAGGGRIHLSAKTITVMDKTVSIIADGQGTTNAGGAGGMIWIDAQNYNMPSNVDEAAIRGGNGLVAGGAGYLYTDSFAPNIFSANGGIASAGGGGGGGRIVLHRTFAEANQPIITKSLEVIGRSSNSGTSVLDANQYALMVGDKISINIAVTGLIPDVSATVEDYFLNSQTGVYCGAPSSIVSPVSASQYSDIDKISWTFTPVTKNVTMSYACEVRKP